MDIRSAIRRTIQRAHWTAEDISVPCGVISTTSTYSQPVSSPISPLAD